MAIDLVLGVDVGTTAVKAAVLDGSGPIADIFAASYPTRRPAPGHAEQDPQDWIRLIDDALQQLAALGIADRVSIGGLCSQVNTHVFVDSEGTPLIPAILWHDTRASAEAAELDARLDDAEKTALLGAPIPIDASHPLARMLWVARNRPRVWERTAHVLLPKDYCLFRLTGRITTDPLSNIGLVGPDLTFVARILELVSGAADRMAPLVEPTEPVGTIRPPFALAGTRLVSGTMDGWTGMFGSGASSNGRSVYISGTSETLGIASLTVNPTPGIIVFQDVNGLRFHAGPTQSGGASQLWFCDQYGIHPDAMGAAVEAHPRAPDTPLFLPQLAGERAPLWNPTLRGAFIGLSAGHGMADLARAVYEGVALSVRHVLDPLVASSGVRSELMLCGGGGFRTDIWGQIRADILGLPLRRLAVNEPGIVGAACLAAYGAGDFSSLEEAHSAFARYDRTWEPDPTRVAFYDELFAAYKEAIPLAANITNRMPRHTPDTC